MKERNYSLDVIRVIACLMVVLMHSPSPDNGLSGILYHSLDMLTEPCIGLFYMVSGSLLMPVKLPYKDFITRRLNKVLWPTIIFSVIVLSLAFAFHEITKTSFIRSFFSIPFSTYKSGVLWFMYPLIGMYLIAPVISPFLERASKREFQFILLLWLVTLCWNPLKLILNVDTSEENILHLFSGYAGYFVLGYYLSRFNITIKPFVFPVLFIVPWGMDASNKIFGWGVSKYDYFWYLSIFCVMQCVAWYQMVRQYFHADSMPPKLKTVLVSFSSCSFGIYLMHRIIMQRIVWNIPFLPSIHPILQVMVIFILTVSISWGITELVSRLPYSNYIIGYKK